MAWTVRKVVESRKDESDGWYVVTEGRWEVVDDAGVVAYRFAFSVTEDHTEWPDRYFEDGPRDVRISADGKFVECFYGLEAVAGFTFEHHPQGKVERHPLPPDRRQ